MAGTEQMNTRGEGAVGAVAGAEERAEATDARQELPKTKHLA